MAKKKPKKRRWTDEKLWEFQEMYENPDLTVQDIANHYNLTKASIYRIAHLNEIKRGTYHNEGSRYCPHCKNVLAEFEFYTNVKGRNGYNSWCKECDKERNRERHRKIKEVIK